MTISYILFVDIDPIEQVDLFLLDIINKPLSEKEDKVDASWLEAVLSFLISFMTRFPTWRGPREQKSPRFVLS